MAEIKPLEKRILRHLQGSEYISVDYEKLAKKEERSVDEIRDIIKDLEKKEIITGYAALIDSEKIGYITAFVQFDAAKKLEKMAEKIKELANKGAFNITEAYIITGSRDIHMTVKVKGLEEYYRFVKEFENLVSLTGTGTGIIGYVKILENPRLLIIS